jgi:hypothetical protein
MASFRSSWQASSVQVSAEEVFNNIGLVFAVRHFLPLMILAALSVWDGC